MRRIEEEQSFEELKILRELVHERFHKQEEYNMKTGGKNVYSGETWQNYFSQVTKSNINSDKSRW